MSGYTSDNASNESSDESPTKRKMVGIIAGVVFLVIVGVILFVVFRKKSSATTPVAPHSNTSSSPTTQTSVSLPTQEKPERADTSPSFFTTDEIQKLKLLAQGKFDGNFDARSFTTNKWILSDENNGFVIRDLTANKDSRLYLKRNSAFTLDGNGNVQWLCIGPSCIDESQLARVAARA